MLPLHRVAQDRVAPFKSLAGSAAARDDVSARCRRSPAEIFIARNKRSCLRASCGMIELVLYRSGRTKRHSPTVAWLVSTSPHFALLGAAYAARDVNHLCVSTMAFPPLTLGLVRLRVHWVRCVAGTQNAALISERGVLCL